jgi:ketosteroid isomerase-like protein
VQAEAQAEATLAAVDRFNEAFNRHDVDAIMAAMTDDCVFESTYPPPDGRRFEGQEAVRGAWEDLFRSSPDASFETEELFVVDDRCTARWTYRYSGADGAPHHIRGVDVFRVRDGKVAEKLSYVKG